MTYKKENFRYKNSEKIFDEIYESDYWKKSDDSKSGGGSSMNATAIIRDTLPQIYARYSIKSILDVPCGDFNWMQITEKPEKYIGGDIVEQAVIKNREKYGSDNIEFQVIDITKNELPAVDLIFCRDCLQHLSEKNVIKALNNIKKSGSTYLLVTSYPKTWKNYNVADGDYHPINLFKKPYGLSKPLTKIKETYVTNEPDKTMYLFEIEKINLAK